MRRLALVLPLLVACSTATTPSAPPAGRTITGEEAGRYLRDAARAGDVEVVTALVRAGTAIEAADEKGYTPLILAAYHGHLAVVDALLAAGADACRGDARGNTALMGAAFKGYDAIVERLGKECPIDQANGEGRTALMFASLVGKTGLVKMIEGLGADGGRKDADGRTAADWAATQLR